MNLYTIKLKISETEDHDSDDGRDQNDKDAKYRFGFIKEMRLALSNSIIQDINTEKGFKKPKFLKIIRY